jgi:hypothetical protein
MIWRRRSASARALLLEGIPRGHRHGSKLTIVVWRRSVRSLEAWDIEEVKLWISSGWRLVEYQDGALGACGWVLSTCRSQPSWTFPH